MNLLSITTKVVSLIPEPDQVYSIQLYVIACLRQFGDFLWIPPFPSSQRK